MQFWQDAPYELASYVQEDQVSLQTYIAGPNEIKVVLQVKDEDGKHSFSTREHTYEFMGNTTNQTISISKG
jgi:hypothetical protein